jgi:hypothetical protein
MVLATVRRKSVLTSRRGSILALVGVLIILTGITLMGLQMLDATAWTRRTTVSNSLARRQLYEIPDRDDFFRFISNGFRIITVHCRCNLVALDPAQIEKDLWLEYTNIPILPRIRHNLCMYLLWFLCILLTAE